MSIFEKLQSKAFMNFWVAIFAMFGAVMISQGNILMGLISIFLLSPLYAHALTSNFLEDYWKGIFNKVVGK